VTYRRLQNDPQTTGNDAEVLAPSLEQADAIAKRLATVPEVSRTLTLDSFVPSDQDQKNLGSAGCVQSSRTGVEPAPAQTCSERSG
jgi:uncharacterized protein